MGVGQSKHALPDVCERVPKLSDVSIELRSVLPRDAFPAGVFRLLLQYYIGLYVHGSSFDEFPMCLNTVHEVFTRTLYYQSFDNPSRHRHVVLQAMYAIDLGQMTYKTSSGFVDGDRFDIMENLKGSLAALWGIYGPKPRRPIPMPAKQNRTWWWYSDDHEKFGRVREDTPNGPTILKAILSKSESDKHALLFLDTHAFNTEWDSYCHKTIPQNVFHAVHRPTGRAISLVGGGGGGICRVLDSKNRMRVIYAQTEPRHWVKNETKRRAFNYEYRLQSVHLDEKLAPVCTPIPTDIKLTDEWTMYPTSIVDSVLVLRHYEARLVDVNTGQTQAFKKMREPVKPRFTQQIVFHNQMAAILCKTICKTTFIEVDALMVIDFQSLTIDVQEVKDGQSYLMSVQWQPL